jgi:hypothetical protein
VPGLEKVTLEIDGESTPIRCWFNPTEYSVSKTNTWKFEPVVGAALPPPQFTGGMPRQLTVELLFDSTDNDTLDVREVTNKLFKAMEVGEGGGGGGRPPMITFGWGQAVPFKAFGRELNVRYTMFKEDGTCTRALATLTLMQADKAQDSSTPSGGTAGGGNPTTRGIDAIRSHVVRDGDSLQSIAYEAYGDPTLWRAVADANGIDDPLNVRRGTRLAIPRSPE